MRKVIFNDGEEAVQEDYNAAQHLAEQALQEALYNLYGQASSGFVASGFKVSADAGMDVEMAAGLGFYYDSSEADADQALFKPMRSTAVRAITVPTANVSNPRIDLVCVAPARIEGEPAERSYMDEGTEAITPEDLNKRDDETYAYQYVTGTPAGSPSAPAVPAGYVAVAQIDVAAAAASITASDITDLRYELPTIQPPGPSSFNFEAVGQLSGMVGLDLDAHGMVSGFVITGILIVCPQTPASGTIEIELLKVSPGGSPTTLYTSNPLPTLTCNGGYALVSFSSPDLPDVTTLAAGEILIARITEAPEDAVDLKVMVL